MGGHTFSFGWKESDKFSTSLEKCVLSINTNSPTEISVATLSDYIKYSKALTGFSPKDFLKIWKDDIDLLEETQKEMLKKYENNYNVSILKGDFYESLHLFRDDSIDILHIDIANNGDTYEFAIENYLTKVKGIMVLEGGSEERDNVEWMQKYEKPKIQSVLKKYSNDVRITVLEDYPSITLIQK